MSQCPSMDTGMAESSLRGWAMGYSRHPLLRGPPPGLQAVGAGSSRGLARGPWILGLLLSASRAYPGILASSITQGREILGSQQRGAREVRRVCESGSRVPGWAPADLEVTESLEGRDIGSLHGFSALPIPGGHLSLRGSAHTCPWSTSQQGLGLPLNCKAAGHLSSRVSSQCPQRI